MIYDTIKIIYDTSSIFLLLTLAYKVYREKYLIVTSLVFWISFFYFCYFTFPCFFIEEINSNWNFRQSTLSYSRGIVFIYNMFFIFYVFAFCRGDMKLKDKFEIKQRYEIVYQIAYFLEFIGWLVIIFSVLSLINIRRSTSGFRAYFIIRQAAETMEAKYHLRMILYLLVPSSFYLFLRYKRIALLLPLVGIVVFESLAGKRTTAFIVLIYLYILYVLLKKKLALKIIVPVLLVLLVGILFARADALDSKVNVFIVFGEFFETFTTLPFIIEHNLIGQGFDLERCLSDYTFASFLPGSIKFFLISYKSVGSEIAKIIGRGYGLGSSFIVEQFYEFGFAAFFTVMFIPVCIVVLDKKLRGAENLLIKIIFAFQLRLYIREGVPQFMVSFYIFVMYFAFFYFLKKKNTKEEPKSIKKFRGI